MPSSKVWFITGASRGFGRVWAEAALGRGDKVIATARNPEALNDLASAHGDALLVLPLDVTDRNAVFDAIGARAPAFCTPRRRPEQWRIWLYGRFGGIGARASYGEFRD
jgi:NADP-dependent 3-hydroxy acid dehydrogenase YdfG